MKYLAKNYAKALVQLLLDGAPLEKIAVHFFALLRKNGDIKKMRQIIPLTERLLYKKTGAKRITIETARIADRTNILKGFIKKGDMVFETINPALIAGIKIRVNNEKQLDFSMQKKLQELFS